MSFDVFGARRDAQSWAIKHAEASSGLLTSALTLRGFTGHEQLDEVGLVHMGGRVYDPILGRFLQADPFIQQPNNTQNLNRYSYVLNNPLNATDPSGYFFQMLVMWAVNYIATAYATTTLGAALGMALQAYSYYGYAQMAVGAIRAIEGGGTAMANFAGGMAKGYAKGMLFNGIMLGLSHLQNSASTNGPDAAKSVDNKQGSDSADGHLNKISDGASAKNTPATGQSKSHQDIQKAIDAKNFQLAAEMAAENLGLDINDTHSFKFNPGLKGAYGQVDIHGNLTLGMDAMDSPEALLSTVGHEFVHIKQWRQGLLDVSGTSQQSHMNEIEAHRWEVDNVSRTGFKAGLDKNYDSINFHMSKLTNDNKYQLMRGSYEAIKVN